MIPDLQRSKFLVALLFCKKTKPIVSQNLYNLSLLECVNFFDNSIKIDAWPSP